MASFLAKSSSELERDGRWKMRRRKRLDQGVGTWGGANSMDVSSRRQNGKSRSKWRHDCFTLRAFGRDGWFRCANDVPVSLLPAATAAGSRLPSVARRTNFSPTITRAPNNRRVRGMNSKRILVIAGSDSSGGAYVHLGSCLEVIFVAPLRPL